jgi:uncharacterized Zn-binding protein involved in type VI secretion
MITRQCIWTGDTTTHGGNLNEGHPNMTYNNTNKAVLVGHKFWCPTCHCWSTFIEGSPRFTCYGVARVLEGHRTSCGAYAIHRLDIYDSVDDDTDTSRFRDRDTQLEKQSAAKANSTGSYSHRFHISTQQEHPVGYIVFRNGSLLDIGTVAKSQYSSGTSASVFTSEADKVYLAVQAPKPLLK